MPGHGRRNAREPLGGSYSSHSQLELCEPSRGGGLVVVQGKVLQSGRGELVWASRGKKQKKTDGLLPQLVGFLYEV